MQIRLVRMEVNMQIRPVRMEVNMQMREVYSKFFLRQRFRSTPKMRRFGLGK